MKIMKRWSVILVTLLLLLSTGTPAFAEEGAGATRQEKAAAAAESAQSYGQSVSLMYALVEDGKVTVSGGTGVYSKTEDRALTSDLLYGIGSVSKV